MPTTTTTSYPGISSESELLRMTSADKAQNP